MRRGTQSAVLFGHILFLIRSDRKDSMRKVGEKLGSAAATVSQVETGTRAVKEPKLDLWAAALGVKKEDLRELWWLTQGWIPTIKGRTFYTDHDDLSNKIWDIVFRYVHYQTIEIPVIGKPEPIVRGRRNSSTSDDINRLIKLLTASERNKVQGYIDALIDCRLSDVK